MQWAVQRAQLSVAWHTTFAYPRHATRKRIPAWERAITDSCENENRRVYSYCRDRTKRKGGSRTLTRERVSTVQTMDHGLDRDTRVDRSE